MLGLVGELAANLFRFLRESANSIVEFLEPAPDSQDKQIIPFDPPFEGGQCLQVSYNIDATFTYDFNGSPINETLDLGNYLGAIGEVSIEDKGNGRYDLKVVANSGNSVSVFGGYYNNSGISNLNITNISVTPNGGAVDNCGNLPNPNSPTPTNENGLSDAPFPDIDGDGVTLVEGIAPLALPSALAAALAALAAANDLAQLATTIANALAELEKANKNRGNGSPPEGGEGEEPEGKPSIVRYTFGFIEGDGYINLYPDNRARYEGIYLDIIIENIPSGFGKEFGRRSPNRYKFRKLGWIAFVSPSFSLFNFQELEFKRNCLPIPEGAVGFYYHLGLDKQINGGAIGYFYKYLPQD